MIRLLLAAICCLPQYWEDSEAVKSMKACVAEITLAQNEGRAPGSEGEAAVAQFVWERMSLCGLDMLGPSSGDVFGIARKNGEAVDTLLSRNVMGYIRGYDAALRDHFIVVGAHIDNIGVNELTVDGNRAVQIFPGANANASGVAMMLELCSKVVSGSLLFKRSVLFVGLGGGTASFAGAWHFLHHSFAKDRGAIDAFVNLDILGRSSNGMMAFTCGNEDINAILASLSSTPQPLKPTVVPNEPYPSDHQVFYDSEIPSVCFTSGRYPEHNTVRDTPDILDYDFMERETEYLYSFLLTLANSPAGVPAFSNKVVSDQSSSPASVRSWADCDVPPSFLGVAGPGSFLKRWVYTYLKYPPECVRDGVQGRVMVEFTIGKDGKLRDAVVVRGVDPQLDEAALTVVNASPKWQPGKIKGQKVDSRMTIPIEFRLKMKK